MKQIFTYLKRTYSKLVIWIFLPIVIITSFSQHRWVNPESVIEWDVKSYYAYLPAFFIHHDLSLEFIKENPNEYSKWIWPVTTETGKKCIVTSMGLSFLYMPFFLIAHLIAGFTGYAQDGYTVPYAFMLHFSALFYVMVGLFYLRKLLLKFFNQITTTITIVVIFLGTNLFYYTAFAAPMSHGYNFGLIAVFIYYVDKWHEHKNLKYTVIIGLLSGLITLIRPTNILVVLIFIFWNTFNLKSIFERINLFLRNYQKILLIIFLFVLVWIPQFIYWKYVSGRFFYFSYENLGATFYWKNPQIFDILFSYRKGWWLYTPVMFISTLGIFFMFKHLQDKFVAVIVFLLINIYVQSSWWCWWFGGSFGHRAFIDSYGILAFPLAVVINQSIRYRWKGYAVLLVLGILSWYNLFQVKQYNKQALHYWWMSKTGYWMNFLHSRPVKGYWETVPIPDYDKARKGVYVSKNLIDKDIYYKDRKVDPQKIVAEIKQSLPQDRHIHNYAARFDITLDSALTIRAMNIYERKNSLGRYIRPVVAREIVDSLISDSVYLQQNKQIIDLDYKDQYKFLYDQTMEELKKVRF
jgi:hypothetical protein